MENIISFVGIAVGLVGLLVGYWQNKQKIQFEKVVRANNWFNFQRANNSSGILQSAINIYREKHKDNIDPDVLGLLAKSDAFAQEVYKESIRQIHFSEPNFTKQDVDEWESDGKIGELDKKFFIWLTQK